jgi:hypothetical protein
VRTKLEHATANSPTALHRLDTCDDACCTGDGDDGNEEEEDDGGGDEDDDDDDVARSGLWSG